jgi:hypothetical protein
MTWLSVPDSPHLFTQAAGMPSSALLGVDHRRNDDVVVIRDDWQTYKQMRTLGHVLPSPIWRTRKGAVHITPWPHQVETADYILDHHRCCVLDSLGCGKTLSALWAADYLLSVGAISQVVITAPLSVCSHVWARELSTHFRHRRTVLLTDMSGAHRRAAVKMRAAEFYIVNHDGLHLVADVLSPGLVIVDEATGFKTPATRRWKTLNGLVQRTQSRLVLMTGTPMAQSPLDTYGLLRLVREKYMSLQRWRDMTMRNVSRFRWVPRDDAATVVATWLQPAVRHAQPFKFDVHRYDVEYDLSPEQTRMLADLKRAARAELAGVEVTAAHAAALASKLLQVITGGVYTFDGEGERIAHTVPASDFFDTITRFVGEADTPVLVFAPFRAAAIAIHKQIADAGLTCGLITGDTTPTERNQYFDAVQSRRLNALVAIPSTMAHGITLTSSRYVLWAAPPNRAEEYEQANGRVIRPGQKNGVQIVHLIGSPIASRLFARLRDKSRLQDAVLDILT